MLEKVAKTLFSVVRNAHVSQLVRDLILVSVAKRVPVLYQDVVGKLRADSAIAVIHSKRPLEVRVRV